VQLPAPTPAPADAPWGANGYPGDTLQFAAYTGSLDLTPGTIVQQVGTINWTVDYTYGGTATAWDYPANWNPILFNLSTTSGMTIDTASGSLTQTGLLDSEWDNDYLSFNDGPTTSFVVDGYQVDVTPLGFAPEGATNFDGNNPWVQPAQALMASFTITATPEPASLALLALGGLTLLRRQRR
jgi:hypothetical protein